MSDAWEKLCDKFHDRTSAAQGDGSYGWIQWKGTDVCLDVNCKCGEITHIDADFTYLIQCGKCLRVYWPTAFIRLVELKGDDLKLANECNEGDGHHFVVSK